MPLITERITANVHTIQTIKLILINLMNVKFLVKSHAKQSIRPPIKEQKIIAPMVITNMLTTNGMFAVLDPMDNMVAPINAMTRNPVR